MYNIQYHMHDGSDGGVIRDGFATIEAARLYWKHYDFKDDYPADECRVDIHEADGDNYGEAVAELN